jgi:hypothetical protein
MLLHRKNEARRKLEIIKVVNTPGPYPVGSRSIGTKSGNEHGGPVPYRSPVRGGRFDKTRGAASGRVRDRSRNARPKGEDGAGAGGSSLLVAAHKNPGAARRIAGPSHVEAPLAITLFT